MTIFKTFFFELYKKTALHACVDVIDTHLFVPQMWHFEMFSSFHSYMSFIILHYITTLKELLEGKTILSLALA